MAASKPEVGIDLSKRILDNQLHSIDQLQTKVGVLLGFDATLIGVIFAFGRTWLSGHVVVGSLTAGLLIVAAAIFGRALWNSDFLEAPDPNHLVAQMNDPKVTAADLQDWATGNLLGAFLTNRTLIVERFSYVNAGIVFLVLGLIVFVTGVFL